MVCPTKTLILEKNNLLESGVAPATIAIVDGVIGLEEEKLHFITRSKIIKRSQGNRYSYSKEWSAATTVSSTMAPTCDSLCNRKIGVFTKTLLDTLTSLRFLSKNPKSAKAILDLKKTVDY